MAFSRPFVLVLRLFAWHGRYFIFSPGVILLLRVFAWRYFVISPGVISGEKTKQILYKRHKIVIGSL